MIPTFPDTLSLLTPVKLQEINQFFHCSVQKAGVDQSVIFYLSHVFHILYLFSTPPPYLAPSKTRSMFWLSLAESISPFVPYDTLFLLTSEALQNRDESSPVCHILPVYYNILPCIGWVGCMGCVPVLPSNNEYKTRLKCCKQNFYH